MQAIIMAGGAGTRLRPLTDDIPKPMVKIIDKPVLDYIIRHLKSYGIYDIGVTLNYKHDVITAHFADGAEYGVKLRYFIEDKPLGTAGSVKAAANYLDENFLVLSGDAFTDINLDELRGTHVRMGQPATMVVKEVADVGGFGVASVSDGIVTGFVEKPEKSTEKTINTGIYMFKREVLKMIPDGFYDFGRNLFPRLVGQIAAYKTDAYWSDIGTLKRYYETNLHVVESNYFS